MKCSNSGLVALNPPTGTKKSDELDARILCQFAATHQQVLAGETADWRDLPEGRPAEIIVLDQFSRNMFRDTAAAFASDALSLALAQEAVRSGDDQKVDDFKRPFIYMPYMHSETAKVHEQAMELFADSDNLAYEVEHKTIIDRFGRYPHRNDILGRPSTTEEVDWMLSNKGF